MSLVVAGIENGHITIVADTKVTFTDHRGDLLERRTRDTYLNALPKIVLLRPELVVGVTGAEPDRAIERLVAVRDRPIAEVLGHLAAEQDAGFVVAALDPCRLWRVSGGTVEDRTTIGRSWEGDSSAYEVFQAQMALEGFAQESLSFRLLASMQFLTTFGPVPSVGGITMRAESGPAGFLFAGNFTRVGPHRMELTAVSVTEGDVQIGLTTPAGVDPNGYDFLVLPGADPTRGAVGLFIPQTARGLVFPEDMPWQARVFPASSVRELVEVAQGDGITLDAVQSPFGP